MNVIVLAAQDRHADWLVVQDGDVSEAWVRRCVALGEYLVAELDGKPAGFLRFSRFWGIVPFMDVIRVLSAHQRRGVGSALFAYWESRMREEGAALLMTSSQEDEPEAQAWHRRNGFHDAGSITFGPMQPAAEIVMLKTLGV